MMLRKKFQLLFLLLLISAPLSAQMQWHSPFDDCGDEPFLCGRAWNKELGLNFHRLRDIKKKLPKTCGDFPNSVRVCRSGSPPIPK